MSVLNIKNCLDPVLRKKCDLIQNIDEGLVTLSDDMIETMYAATGVGLAANQVGISSRLIVVDLGFKEEKHVPLIIVNPVIAKVCNNPGREMTAYEWLEVSCSGRSGWGGCQCPGTVK